jgi:hypothetical protein
MTAAARITMTQIPSMSSAPQQKEEPSSTADLDRVALTQALRDFEIANTRVLDLTQRLIESERQRKDAENELEHLRLKINTAGHETLSYRVARWVFHRAREVAQRVLGAKQ